MRAQEKSVVCRLSIGGLGRFKPYTFYFYFMCVLGGMWNDDEIILLSWYNLIALFKIWGGFLHSMFAQHGCMLWGFLISFYVYDDILYSSVHLNFMWRNVNLVLQIY